LASEEQINGFRSYVEGLGYEFFPIMAAIRYQVDPLLNRIDELLSKLPPVRQYQPEPAPMPAETSDDNKVSISRRSGVYVVEGEWLRQTMRSVNFADADSLRYFESVLEKTGVIDALRAAGIHEGDTVSLYDFEFNFME
jgi:GTP-binding protein